LGKELLGSLLLNLFLPGFVVQSPSPKSSQEPGLPRDDSDSIALGASEKIYIYIFKEIKYLLKTSFNI
jgi:hypothetical protein